MSEWGVNEGCESCMGSIIHDRSKKIWIERKEEQRGIAIDDDN